MSMDDFVKHLVPFNDETAQDHDRDPLDTKRFVDRLWQAVRNCRTPHHILLLAAWGTGKSTVLESVRALAEETPGMSTVYINAWAYGRDSLRQKLMKEVSRKASHPNPSRPWAFFRKKWPRKPFSMDTFVRANVVSLWQRLSTSVYITLALLVLVSLIGGAETLAREQNLWSAQALRYWLERSAGALLQAHLIVFVFTFITAEFRKTPVIQQMTTDEQYEEAFEEALRRFHRSSRPSRWRRMHKQAEQRDSRLVVLVDDVDRCSAKQVLEVLETIKTFMNKPGCVFLVACDREVLEAALRETVAARPNQVQAYVDKVFETVVQIPPYSKRILEQYAKELLANDLFRNSGQPQDMKGRFEEFAREVEKTGALSILLDRKWVDTPRKVKRILNDFMMQVELAAHRGVDWPSKATWVGLAQDTIMMTEFPRFAPHLASYPDLRQWLCTLTEGSAHELSPEQLDICREFYDTDRGEATEGWEGLIDFISLTTVTDRSSGAGRSGDEVLLRPLKLAEAGQYEKLARLCGEPGARARAISQIALAARSSKKTVEERITLLLALLRIVSADVDRHDSGVQTAARLLQSHSHLLLANEKMWTEDSIAGVLQCMETIFESQGVRDWTDGLLKGVGADHAARGYLLLGPAMLSLSEKFRTAAPEGLSESVLVWLQTDTGRENCQEYLQQIAEGFSVDEPWILKMVERQWTWITTSTPTDQQKGVVASCVLAFSPHLDRPECEGLFDLACESLPFLGNQVTDVLREKMQKMAAKIPVHRQAALAELLATHSSRDLGSILRSLDDLLHKHPTLSLPDGYRIVDALVAKCPDEMFELVSHFVLHHWNRWGGVAQTRFRTALLRLLDTTSSSDQFRIISSWLVRAIDHPPEMDEQQAYSAILERQLRKHFNDPAWLTILYDFTGPSRPFPLPEAARSRLSSTMTELVFDSLQGVTRQNLLVALAPILRRLDPGPYVTVWINRILNECILGDPRDEGLVRAGVQALQKIVKAIPNSHSGDLATVLDKLLGCKNPAQRRGLLEIIPLLPSKVVSQREQDIASFLELEFMNNPSLVLTAQESLTKRASPEYVLNLFGPLTTRPSAYKEAEEWLIRKVRSGSIDLVHLFAHGLRNSAAHRVIYKASLISTRTRTALIGALCAAIDDPEESLRLLTKFTTDFSGGFSESERVMLLEATARRLPKTAPITDKRWLVRLLHSLVKDYSPPGSLSRQLREDLSSLSMSQDGELSTWIRRVLRTLNHRHERRDSELPSPQ